MITRPMALLIIIGDHEALSSDKNWEMLVKYCEQNGAMMCGKRKVHPRVEAP